MASEKNIINVNASIELFKCETCDKKFVWKKSLLKHHRSKHPNVVMKNLQKLSCTFCNSEFTEKPNLTRHIKKFHSENPRKISLLLCSLCNFSSNSSEKLHFHYQGEHDIAIHKECMSFSNREEFFLWKENEQRKSVSRYIQHTRVKKNQNGSESMTFYCHRVGAYTLKSIRQRREREQGTKKTGRNCPSRIYVKISKDGSVNVDYVKTHVGHRNELYHIHLTALEKMNIAKKLAMNISCKDILSDIRSKIDFDNLKRLDLVTSKDLYNIRNYCKETSSMLQEAEKIPLKLAEEIEKIMTAENECSNSLDAIDINPEGFQDLAQRCIDELVQSIQDNISIPGDLDIGNNIPKTSIEFPVIKEADSISLENINDLFSGRNVDRNGFNLENMSEENIEMSCTVSLSSDMLNIRCDILQNM